MTFNENPINGGKEVAPHCNCIKLKLFPPIICTSRYLIFSTHAKGILEKIMMIHFMFMDYDEW